MIHIDCHMIAAKAHMLLRQHAEATECLKEALLMVCHPWLQITVLLHNFFFYFQRIVKMRLHGNCEAKLTVKSGLHILHIILFFW